MNAHPATLIALAAHRQAEMREYARKRRLHRQARAHRKLVRALASAGANGRKPAGALSAFRRRYGN